MEAYQATEKQNKFHGCNADEVLYGGAAGGGKSKALVMEAFVVCHENPNIYVGLFRRTFPELRRTLIREALLSFPKDSYDYNKTEHTMVFKKTGSTLEFCHCQREEDVIDYQSAEFQFLGFDELTHFTEFQYLYLQSRLRTTDPSVWVRTRSATNPGGVGHGWVKRRFITPAPPNKVWTDDHGITRAFIPAKIWDNPYLMENDPSYEKRLQGLPEEQRRALLEGDWDVFEGQVFTEFRRDRHVVKPFELGDSWNKYVWFDWGRAAPGCAYWAAFDTEGRGYIYRELYEAGLSSREWIKAIRERSKGERIEAIIADPSIWNKDKDGASIAEDFFEGWSGVSVLPGNNDRINGKERVHKWLADAPDGKPWLQVFANCPNWIRTIPELIYSHRKVEDVDTDGEDHAYDATRYGLMARPMPYEVVVPATHPTKAQQVARHIDELAEAKRLKREYKTEISWEEDFT